MTLQAEAALKPLPYTEVADDDQLVRRCQAADSANSNFNPIVEKYKNDVFRMAMSMTHDYALADDLTQETFLKAWLGIGSFRTGRSLKPWLFRILQNCLASHWRKGRVPVVPMTLLEARRSEELEPDAVYEQAERHEQVQRAIAKLPFELRWLVNLFYYQGLSVPEIVQVMSGREGRQLIGWREGTVKSRLNRARRKLREILDREGYAR